MHPDIWKRTTTVERMSFSNQRREVLETYYSTPPTVYNIRYTSSLAHSVHLKRQADDADDLKPLRIDRRRSEQLSESVHYLVHSSYSSSPPYRRSSTTNKYLEQCHHRSLGAGTYNLPNRCSQLSELDYLHVDLRYSAPPVRLPPKP